MSAKSHKADTLKLLQHAQQIVEKIKEDAPLTVIEINLFRAIEWAILAAEQDKTLYIAISADHKDLNAVKEGDNVEAMVHSTLDDEILYSILHSINPNTHIA